MNIESCRAPALACSGHALAQTEEVTVPSPMGVGFASVVRHRGPTPQKGSKSVKALMIITVVGTSSAASAQFGFACSPGTDLCIFGRFDTAPNEYFLEADFTGDLPAGATAITTVWSDASFTLTGDAPITITGWNPGFNSALFGQPQITGNGTTEVTFSGVMPANPIGTPDSSNPLRVIDFSYSGSLFIFRGELVGQNSAIFSGDPANPFGTPVLYQDALGNPGALKAEFANVPAPGAMALAPLALVVARRRRK